MKTKDELRADNGKHRGGHAPEPTKAAIRAKRKAERRNKKRARK